MLLARLETQFENFPAAIAAYATAAAIRPDRADFPTARGRLEERLMRFDDAVTSYAKTYELTYHDPQWMEKIAELRARQNRTEEAAKALRTALVEGRPERPENFFAVARRLELWACRGGEVVRRPGRAVAGLPVCFRAAHLVGVYTKLRQTAAAFDRLFAARTEAKAAVGQGKDPSSLEHALSARLDEMGEVVARAFSPEEKTAFAAFLEQKRTAMPRPDADRFLPELAERAGLFDLAVRWRTELMEANRQGGFHAHLARLVDLQTRRLRFAELAGALERFAVSGARTSDDAARVGAPKRIEGGDAAGELGCWRKSPQTPVRSDADAVFPADART